jgi:hypothetical protein
MLAGTKVKTMDEQRRKLQNEEKMKFIINEEGILDDTAYVQEQDRFINQIAELLSNKQQVLSRRSHRHNSILLSLLDIFNRLYGRFEEVLTLESKNVSTHRAKEPELIESFLLELRASVYSRLKEHFRNFRPGPPPEVPLQRQDASTLTHKE